jgi:hypothetical protein
MLDMALAAAAALAAAVGVPVLAITRLDQDRQTQAAVGAAQSATKLLTRQAELVAQGLLSSELHPQLLRLQVRLL